MGEGNKKYRLLIVDDVAENLHAMMNILRDHYSLLVATSGERALALAANEPQPDLILLDIKMPGMDGYEVLKRLKSDPATAMIPVIFVTALSEATDEARGLNLGAVDYITKPVNADLLKRRVLTQLELKHYRRTPLVFGIDEEQMPQTSPGILVVDDMPENVHGLVSALSDEYRVMVAESGARAIEVVNSANAPDLILLDIKMPGMDGYEVCQRIRADEKGRSIPIIFLSVLDEPIEKVRGFAIGGADYITKPFDIDEVHARVRTHLELRQYRLHLEDLVKLRTAELTESEKNFRQAQKMEALGTLVGGIAHDFNNILAAMLGSIYLAKNSSDDSEMVNKSLESADELGFRAADMIKQLLTFARQEEVNKKIFSLVPFFKEANKLVGRALEENIRFTTRINCGELLVNANSTQLQQILFNLVNNARDALHGSEAPEIIVSLEKFEVDAAFRERHPEIKGEHFAVIEVQDSGEGIPDENLPKLFDPFFSTKEVGKGTGLGLAMVYGSVRDHGGVLEVESVEGEGSRFRVYLPLEEGAVSHADHEDDNIHKGRGEIILLVDDDMHLRTTNSAILTSLGYQVLVASDGREAVDCFAANPGKVDLVFMDVVMPVMSGPAAVRKMREIDPRVKVIYLTGYDSKGALTSQLDRSREVVINKPCPISYLSRIVREQLDLP
ncbi:response regulator [Mariprofundus sp. KV]|uniref:response regulator n=1 Tax=Mariprofundus sp. KV TaxID=2608715 RepID=UPI00159F9318|nr:response regulator [Mariprofundus sp. KV]NWF35645.1 response regulator [Mariprofundus sp. KV]